MTDQEKLQAAIKTLRTVSVNSCWIFGGRAFSAEGHARAVGAVENCLELIGERGNEPATETKKE